MSEVISDQGKIVITEELHQKCMRYIAVQARVAFTKANHNSFMVEEDYAAIGLEVLEVAKEKWSQDGGSKFTTFFTLLLKNRLYKAIRASHQKKRGGGGCKQDEIRFGHTERWENGEAQKSVAKMVSIETSAEDADHSGGATTSLQIAAPSDNTVEYELLLKQMESLMPKNLQRVFKQMVDPDPELLEIAVIKYKDEKKFRMDNEIVADYLKIDVSKLRTYQKEVKAIIGKHLGR